MNRRLLLDHVGENLYLRACEWAWATAAGTGKSIALGDRDASWPEEVVMIPHDLDEVLWSAGDALVAERLELALALYREMPCYATLMFLKDKFAGFGPPERERLWREYGGLLDQGDERLADPVSYSLWVDFFEDGGTVKEAWNALAEDPGATERRLDRILDTAGPVPWDLKARVYHRLLPQPRWHPAILKSLVHSKHDVFGEIDRAAARRILNRLEVSPRTEQLSELREALVEPKPKRRRKRFKRKR